MKIINTKQAELGLSTQDTLSLFICHTNARLDSMIPTSSGLNVDDVEGFGLSIIKKCVKMLDTLVLVCVEAQDYIVANAIVRMLADSLAVYKLIYGSTDEDEKEYRHYLYVKDGISSRIKTMKNDLAYDGTIPYESFQMLNDRYQNTRDSDYKIIEHCNKKLSKHKYAISYPEFHNQTSIIKSNWKFKILGSPSKAKLNQYTWKELYSLIDSREDIIDCISSHLSQYIHGLCLSNISDNDDIDEFEPFLSFGMKYIGIINNELDRLSGASR